MHAAYSNRCSVAEGLIKGGANLLSKSKVVDVIEIDSE